MKAPSRGTRRALLLGVPIVMLSIAGMFAAALAPTLVRDHPLLLLVLESRSRYLLLVNVKVSVVPFVVVGVLRRLASDPFFYLLGRWYGDQAVELLTQRIRRGYLVGRLRRKFERYAGLAVFVFPGALTCALAGAVGMAPKRFAFFNIAGTVTAVVAVRLVGNALEGPLQAIVGFNDRNAGWLTALFCALVIGWLVLRHRRRGPLRDTYRRFRRLTASDD